MLIAMIAQTARETSQAAAKRTAEMFGKVGQQAQNLLQQSPGERKG